MKLCKLILACGALAGLGVSGVSVAEEAKPHKEAHLHVADKTHEFSANVALSTDYVWRGVSQTDNGPAISGGFDYAHSSGLYAGVWASNVDFGDGDDSNIEMDIYAGYGGEFMGVSFDVGVLHYDYASENNNNFDEVYVGLGYGFLSAKVSYSSDGFAESDDATYYEIGADFELPWGVGLALHAGRYDVDAGSEDYSDWRVSLSKELVGLNFELAYTDTDMSDSECTSYAGDDNLCDGRGVFTVSKEF